MKKITIVGSGNSTHVVEPLLANLGFTVTILTSKPDLWKKTLFKGRIPIKKYRS